MKNQSCMRRIICTIFVVFVVSLLVPVEVAPGAGIVKAAKARLNYTSKSLLKGESFQLIVKNKKAIQFISSNKKVAVVNKKGIVTAKRKGTAVIKVKLSNKKMLTCKVKVRNEVDLIIFAGQSNMTGAGGDTPNVSLTDGAGYECKTITSPLELTPIVEPFGKKQDNSVMNDAPYRYGTLVTAFVNSYYEQTGVPVVGVSATAVGTNSSRWDNIYSSEVARRANIAKQTLDKKGIKVRNCYLVFYQGEADAMEGFTAIQYTNNVTSFFKKVKSKAGVRKCFLIRIGYLQSNPELFEEIAQAQTELCAKKKDFVLVSIKAAALSEKYYRPDGLHLNQKGLDVVGAEAGEYAGGYVVTGKKAYFLESCDDLEYFVKSR